ALVDRLQRDKLSPEAALSALEELERKPINDPLWIRLLSWAGVCAASTLLLGGNALEIVVCFLIVLPAQFCRQWIAEKNVPSPVGDLFAAFLVTAIALIISRGRLAVSTNIVIAGSLFGLVPGAAIVSSAQDLIGGDLLPQRRGQELFIATLLSTLVIGCISRIIATLQRVPVSVYTIPGIV